MHTLYYANKRGRMAKPVGGIRRYCRKGKYYRMHINAKNWAAEVAKKIKWE